MRKHKGDKVFAADLFCGAGNRDDQVKQIGNAVPVRTGRALCTAILADMVGGGQ